jgi:tRNA-splicing ligase RtcB (3'-phosphate/5'-hydroxy nucleic acid ligase)
MLDTTHNFNKTNTGVPIKAWTKGVQLEDAARGQLTNVAQLPLFCKWVAAMPDVDGVSAPPSPDA